MYLPRNLISKLYIHLLRTRHLSSPHVLLLVALEPDALCACRILTALLKRDYIQHKIRPIAGYGDLKDAGTELVRPMRTSEGGSGGIVICLGVGGLMDLESILDLESDEDGGGGPDEVEVWVMDARRPWNLANVFGGQPPQLLADSARAGGTLTRNGGVEKGRITHSYQPGKGGIIVFDDGDIEEELGAQQEAYCALADMPQVDDGEDESDASESEDELEGAPPSGQGQKRKSWSDRDESDSDDEGNPRRRRRTNSSTAVPSSPERSPLHRTTLDNSSDLSRQGSHASGSSSPLPGESRTTPSARTLRRRLLRLRRKHERVVDAYVALGSSYSEPISSIMYSLASELGREDNDLLWYAIIGVSSVELYGRTMSGIRLTNSTDKMGRKEDRGERVRAIMRDEVRRLNHSDPQEYAREHYLGDTGGGIPTHARSPTDTAIRLSPEPRFLLIRHWSLYDSMLHSPYLSSRLRVWSEPGKRRLHKLLAKMGVSLAQCKQTYTHMDMDLKRSLRDRLLKFGPVYGLEDLVPPAQAPGDREGWGFVRCWGWKACLSATDVAVILGAILEVADPATAAHDRAAHSHGRVGNAANGDLQVAPNGAVADVAAQEAITARFWTAYDALGSIDMLTSHIRTAQLLHRAILRTGSALIEKRQIRHLRAFRMAVVRDGPDVALFTHPGALVKLALWLAEAIEEKEGSSRKKGKKGTELVVAGLDEVRNVYVVVGLGGGGGTSIQIEKKRAERRKEKEKKREAKRAERERVRAERAEDEDGEPETEEESDDTDSDTDDEEDAKKNNVARNRFGIAFQEALNETGARNRVDSFEHCVIEVEKEDLSGFLESLSMKTVVA